MGAHFKRLQLQKMVAGMRQVEVEAVPYARVRMGVIAENGAEFVRNVIENESIPPSTVGSHERFAGNPSYAGHDKASPRGRSAGREDTGLMHDSVHSRIREGGRAILAEFGWTDVYEDYFGYQDDGVSVKNLTGMFALRDARADAVVELDILGRDLIKRAANSIGGRSNGL